MKIDDNFLPNNWKLIPLPELVFFQEGPGVRKNQFTDTGIKLINVRNIVDNELILANTETHISDEEANGKYNHFLVDEGDLIIASSGIKVDYFDKKIAFAEKKHLPLCMNTSTIRFKTLDRNVLNINYFRWFLSSNFFKKQVQFHITGSAQLNFGPTHLKKMKVILPPFKIQKKIVEILEKAERLKTYREKADNLTEDYLKSIFLEMFGDIGKNSKNYEMVTINDTVVKTKNENPKNEYPNEYFDYIDISSIDSSIGKIVSSTRYLGSEAPSRARQKIKANDLLVSTVRPNLNAVGLVTEKFDNQIASTDFCVLRTNENVVPEYLLQISRSEYFIQSLVNQCKGASYPAVNNGDILNLKIPLPPIELQNKFAEIVEIVEKIKEYQSQSKLEIDNLFNNLMQKAFKGELAS